MRSVILAGLVALESHAGPLQRANLRPEQSRARETGSVQDWHRQDDQYQLQQPVVDGEYWRSLHDQVHIRGAGVVSVYVLHQ